MFKNYIYIRNIQKITFKRKNKYRCQRRLMNFSRHNFSKKEISTRGYGKRIRKNYGENVSGWLLVCVKDFFLYIVSRILCTNRYICCYRTVKYGKMINTEAAQLYT